MYLQILPFLVPALNAVSAMGVKREADGAYSPASYAPVVTSLVSLLEEMGTVATVLQNQVSTGNALSSYSTESVESEFISLENIVYSVSSFAGDIKPGEVTQYFAYEVVASYAFWVTHVLEQLTQMASDPAAGVALRSSVSSGLSNIQQQGADIASIFASIIIDSNDCADFTDLQTSFLSNYTSAFASADSVYSLTTVQYSIPSICPAASASSSQPPATSTFAVSASSAGRPASTSAGSASLTVRSVSSSVAVASSPATSSSSSVASAPPSKPSSPSPSYSSSPSAAFSVPSSSSIALTSATPSASSVDGSGSPILSSGNKANQSAGNGAGYPGKGQGLATTTSVEPSSAPSLFNDFIQQEYVVATLASLLANAVETDSGSTAAQDIESSYDNLKTAVLSLRTLADNIVDSDVDVTATNNLGANLVRLLNILTSKASGAPQKKRAVGTSQASFASSGLSALQGPGAAVASSIVSAGASNCSKLNGIQSGLSAFSSAYGAADSAYSVSTTQFPSIPGTCAASSGQSAPTSSASAPGGGPDQSQATTTTPGTGNGAGQTGQEQSVTTTTTVVTAFTTVCSASSTFSTNGHTYTVTSGQTLTITNCPCTITTVCSTTTRSSSSSGAQPSSESDQNYQPTAHAITMTYSSSSTREIASGTAVPPGGLLGHPGISGIALSSASASGPEIANFATRFGQKATAVFLSVAAALLI